MRICRVLPSIAALVALAACVDRLPSQDRRILAARPVAKMPAEDLAAEYAHDAKAANRHYWGKAVEITGLVGDTHKAADGSSVTFVDTHGAAIFTASLLDDEGPGIIAGLGDDRRLTLRCFCDKAGDHLVLESCIKP